MQCDLFSAASLAPTIQVPPAPALDLASFQEWPSPGYTPRECAQAALSRSSEYMDMLAAVVKAQSGNRLSSDGLKALIPDDWRKLIGKYLHASMVEWQCKPRGIELSYLPRPDGFPVFMYQAKEGAQQG